MAFFSMEDASIALDLDIENIKTLTEWATPGPRRDRITIGAIKKATCDIFDITRNHLEGEMRARHISRPRMVGMYASSLLTNASLPQIGRAFNRDHTTVLHAVRTVPTWKNFHATRQYWLGLERIVEEVSGC